MTPLASATPPLGVPPRTSHRSIHASAWRWLVGMACLALIAPARILAADAPVIFSAIGDAPYGDSQVPVFQSYMEKQNQYSPSELFVHLGDIFSGSETCDEFRYQRVADMLHLLTVPAYVV